jgi:spermidine synthase
LRTGGTAGSTGSWSPNSTGTALSVIPFLYLLFFLSGAAALIYEVAWVRQFSLVFGGSHLAVATVLSVFMGGLALGSYLFGKRVEDHPRPLRLYGLLEVGIAVSAASLLILLKWYPHLYVPLARLDVDNPVYLSFLRVVFAAAAMIVPTTLMGGTLPILTRFVSAGSGRLGKHLSFLYGFNTIGAASGTLAAGFLLIPYLGLRNTIAIAIGVNTVIGFLSIALQAKEPVPVPVSAGGAPRRKGAESIGEPSSSGTTEPGVPAPVRFVLWGIGISGFCALGYEVLWTRVLSMVIGATVYSFTIMLVSFLTGIAAGSVAYGLFLKIAGEKEKGSGSAVARFGLIQVLIGAVALFVTYTLRDLPAHAIRIQNFLLRTKISEFEVRQGANLLVAFSYMFAPAFLMGIALPMAGKIRSGYMKTVGRTVGEVLAIASASSAPFSC